MPLIDGMDEIKTGFEALLVKNDAETEGGRCWAVEPQRKILVAAMLVNCPAALFTCINALINGASYLREMQCVFMGLYNCWTGVFYKIIIRPYCLIDSAVKAYTFESSASFPTPTLKHP